jgi:hypothetical protein
MQIYLETEQRLRLTALARAHGRPAAELIREAVSRYLEEQTESVSPRDPLFDLIGAAGDLETATDVSSHKHRYLALADVARSRYTPKARKPRRAESVRKRRGRAR